MSAKNRTIYFNVFFFAFAFLTSICSDAQVVAHAGTDVVICPGSIATIGATPAATGGTPPYTYSWSPTGGLSNPNIPNPTASPGYSTDYYLTVTDDSGYVSTDAVNITYKYILYVTAGNDTSICQNSYATLGGTLNISGVGVTYSWSPSTFLDNPSLPRPTCTPIGTSMSYTLTATISGCTPKIDVVNVHLIPTPPISAGADTTIKKGERAILNGSGGFYYSWAPTGTLMYYYTAHPNAEPLVTTTYVVYAYDDTKECISTDSVTVFVEPSNDVVIYNTFTPNGDQNNDFWYIGNIENYPDNKLEVYNRYGKLVFRTTGYLNDWEGKAFGNDLPEATYFYILDLGKDTAGNDYGTYHGTVTIIK